jgi:glycosyltransferase involved in cell wall biosynthesis
MIAFVTSIRHPANATSYTRVGALLDATLRSVCRQTDPNFRVLVVHNELPKVEFSHPSIEYVEVDFPPPSERRGTSQIEYLPHLFDKGTKYAIGVAAAREHGIQHVMFFDADDLIHHGLAAVANADPQAAGWYSPTGYIHSVGTGVVSYVPDGFHLKNGSTSIVREDLTGVPRTVTRTSSISDIARLIDRDHLHHVLGGHGQWDKFFGANGQRINPLPFAAAIWELGTGENWTGNLVTGRMHEPISGLITDAFGLERPPLVARWRAASSLAARRVVRKLRP